MTLRAKGGIVADADQLRAAWQAGYDHGKAGGSRSADPHVHGDRDMHTAWDEGWIAGSDDEPYLCNACGKPMGTGTLFDAVPVCKDVSMPPPIWRRFASRYRCPICAEERP